MATIRRHRARVEERGVAARRLEGAVGVPEAVAHLEEADAGVLRPDLAVGIHVRNVGEFLAHAQLLVAQRALDRYFQRPEILGEREVLLGGRALGPETDE